MSTLWLQQNKSLNRAKLIFLKYIHRTLWQIWDVLQGIQYKLLSYLQKWNSSSYETQLYASAVKTPITDKWHPKFNPIILCFTVQDMSSVWPLYAPIEVVSHTGLAQGVANYFLRLQFPYIFRFLSCSAFISSLKQSKDTYSEKFKSLTKGVKHTNNLKGYMWM